MRGPREPVGGALSNRCDRPDRRRSRVRRFRAASTLGPFEVPRLPGGQGRSGPDENADLVARSPRPAAGRLPARWPLVPAAVRRQSTRPGHRWQVWQSWARLRKKRPGHPSCVVRSSTNMTSASHRLPKPLRPRQFKTVPRQQVLAERVVLAAPKPAAPWSGYSPPKQTCASVTPSFPSSRSVSAPGDRARSGRYPIAAGSGRRWRRRGRGRYGPYFHSQTYPQPLRGR